MTGFSSVHVGEDEGGYGHGARWKPSFLSAHATPEADTSRTLFERILGRRMRVTLERTMHIDFIKWQLQDSHLLLTLLLRRGRLYNHIARCIIIQLLRHAGYHMIHRAALRRLILVQLIVRRTFLLTLALLATG